MSYNTNKSLEKNGTSLQLYTFSFVVGIQEGSHNRTFPQEH